MTPSPSDMVERIRREQFADNRLTLADIQVIERPDTVRLIGTVLDRPAADAFVSALRDTAPSINWHDELTPLVAGPAYGWALLNRAVLDLRREPSSSAERISQVVFGEAVEVLRRHESWAFVRLPDGYLGWIHAQGWQPGAPLALCDAATAHGWATAATHVVTRPLLPYYPSPAVAPLRQSALLPFGALLHVEQQQGGWSEVRFPDGTAQWLKSSGIVSLARRPKPTVRGLRTAVTWLHGMIGLPYLWGGRSPFGYDCSGLAQALYNLLGVSLRRDADQQAAQGRPVAFDDIQFGDLIFTDTSVSAADLAAHGPRNVTHVMIALDGDDFLHASFRAYGLYPGSFNPASPFYLPSFRERFISARRYM